MSQEIEVITTLDVRLKLIKNTVAKELTDNEFLLFANIAKTRGLDIMLGQMHAIKRAGKITYTVSIDGLRALASRTKEYAGSDEPIVEFGADGKPIKATVTVYRIVQGQKCSFTATAYWSEYYPGQKMGFMWDKFPVTMLSKVAEAHALRKGFSSDLGGLYAEEEFHRPEKDVSPRTEELNKRFLNEPKKEVPSYMQTLNEELSKLEKEGEQL